jgi:hypothetical protein
MYAIKIRKSDLPLLKLLNFGLEPPVGTKTMYLVIHLENNVDNEILPEKEFFDRFEPASNGPELIKLKKSRY